MEKFSEPVNVDWLWLVDELEEETSTWEITASRWARVLVKIEHDFDENNDGAEKICLRFLCIFVILRVTESGYNPIVAAIAHLCERLKLGMDWNLIIISDRQNIAGDFEKMPWNNKLPACV